MSTGHITAIGNDDAPHISSLPEVRLDESRRELKDLFDPPDEARNTAFPRSKLMRSFTGNGALAWLALGAGGVLLAKPKLLMTVARMVPVGAIVRMATLKYLGRRL
jgi:hypothetical protein